MKFWGSSFDSKMYWIVIFGELIFLGCNQSTKIKFSSTKSPSSPMSSPTINPTSSPAVSTNPSQNQFLKLSNFQPASIVIGQPNFSSTEDCCDPTLTHLVSPSGITVVNNILYIADRDRILRYNQIPTVNHAPANFAFGQNDNFDYYYQVSQIENQIYVTSQYKLSVWRTSPTPSNTDPNSTPPMQNPDYTLNYQLEECSGSIYSNPPFFLKNNKLILADTGNNRVLIWNNIPKDQFPPPDLVLGQPDFKSCQLGQGPNNMNSPIAIWTDGTRLFVADSENNRILGWRRFPTRNGTPADFILGQPSFYSNESGSTRL